MASNVFSLVAFWNDFRKLFFFLVPLFLSVFSVHVAILFFYRSSCRQILEECGPNLVASWKPADNFDFLLCCIFKKKSSKSYEQWGETIIVK